LHLLFGKHFCKFILQFVHFWLQSLKKSSQIWSLNYNKLFKNIGKTQFTPDYPPFVSPSPSVHDFRPSVQSFPTHSEGFADFLPIKLMKSSFWCER
jgi:hypothetical protein